MELRERLAHLEDELNLLKTEVKAILVDLREELLQRNSPFVAAAPDVVPAAAAVAVAPHMAAAPEVPQAASRLAGNHAAPEIAEPRTSARYAAPHATGSFTASTAEFESASDRHWGTLDIASLCKWAEASARRIGQRRLGDVLEVYESLSGPFPGATKEAIRRVADLCDEHQEPESVEMNDIVVVLTQLDGLLREPSRSGLTVLSLLSAA